MNEQGNGHSAKNLTESSDTLGDALRRALEISRAPHPHGHSSGSSQAREQIASELQQLVSLYERAEKAGSGQISSDVHASKTATAQLSVASPSCAKAPLSSDVEGGKRPGETGAAGPCSPDYSERASALSAAQIVQPSKQGQSEHDGSSTKRKRYRSSDADPHSSSPPPKILRRKNVKNQSEPTLKGRPEYEKARYHSEEEHGHYSSALNRTSHSSSNCLSRIHPTRQRVHRIPTACRIEDDPESPFADLVDFLRRNRSATRFAVLEEWYFGKPWDERRALGTYTFKNYTYLATFSVAVRLVGYREPLKDRYFELVDHRYPFIRPAPFPPATMTDRSPRDKLSDGQVPAEGPPDRSQWSDASSASPFRRIDPRQAFLDDSCVPGWPLSTEQLPSRTPYPSRAGRTFVPVVEVLRELTVDEPLVHAAGLERSLIKHLRLEPPWDLAWYYDNIGVSDLLSYLALTQRYVDVRIASTEAQGWYVRLGGDTSKPYWSTTRSAVDIPPLPDQSFVISNSGRCLSTERNRLVWQPSSTTVPPPDDQGMVLPRQRDLSASLVQREDASDSRESAQRSSQSSPVCISNDQARDPSRRCKSIHSPDDPREVSKTWQASEEYNEISANSAAHDGQSRTQAMEMQPAASEAMDKDDSSFTLPDLVAYRRTHHNSLVNWLLELARQSVRAVTVRDLMRELGALVSAGVMHLQLYDERQDHTLRVERTILKMQCFVDLRIIHVDGAAGLEDCLICLGDLDTPYWESERREQDIPSIADQVESSRQLTLHQRNLQEGHSSTSDTAKVLAEVQTDHLQHSRSFAQSDESSGDPTRLPDAENVRDDARTSKRQEQGGRAESRTPSPMRGRKPSSEVVRRFME